MTTFTRRTFLATCAAATCMRGAWGAEPRTPDQTLDDLINQNQDNGLGSGFDSASRSLKPPQSALPTLSPATAEATRAAIARYEAIAARGGWPDVPAVARMRVGGRHAAVPALRERLQVEGDLDLNSGDPQVFDSYVDAAVQRFQLRHGLNADGVVRDATWRALNVPAPIRLSQLKTNAARLNSLSHLGDRVLVANIPAAQIEAIEGGIVVSRHPAIPGKPDRPSPDLQSKIVQVDFNPLWLVPMPIIRAQLIPRIAIEPDYLSKNHIRIFDAGDNEVLPSRIDWSSIEAGGYRFKQEPGEYKLLGSIRIDLPGFPGIAMHDTPAKSLFGDDFRFASPSGMRLQNVRELVSWVLTDSPGWSKAEIDEVIRSGQRKDARAAKTLPLYWAYVTAWATPDGVVQFRDDIYNRDGFGAQTNAGRG